MRPTLHVPSIGSHTGLGLLHDLGWQLHLADDPSPTQSGIVVEHTPPVLPQTHWPATHRLLSPEHSSPAHASKI